MASTFLNSLGAGVAAACLLGPLAATAQDFPTRPIRVVVTSSPGSTGDVWEAVKAAKDVDLQLVIGGVVAMISPRLSRERRADLLSRSDKSNNQGAA